MSDTVTQIGADGRRHPVEESGASDEGAAPRAATTDASIRSADYEDDLVKGGAVDPESQIGPDGKRVPREELEANAEDVEPRSTRIDPDTQVTADGSRVPISDVDPDAPAPRFDSDDAEAPEAVVSREDADKFSEDAALTVAPRPGDTTAPADDTAAADSAEDGPPAKSASKADWVDYAVEQGMSREDAEAATKDDLIDQYT